MSKGIIIWKLAFLLTASVDHLLDHSKGRLEERRTVFGSTKSIFSKANLVICSDALKISQCMLVQDLNIFGGSYQKVFAMSLLAKTAGMVWNHDINAKENISNIPHQTIQDSTCPIPFSR
ncbi:hypothetical protein PHYBLDRAFT_72664 [Phycomyces blakesleeanus NRRL 1555(-)]|uniref:Uncharacterized protein n=1 Tax=Phycomyces blakesleeanus (strain ATCC 8743b / DSM 1359 / FGSC 10004 / NBRC 33097 / NRRL 1555) TaxID=763407 RepID=A0A167KB93_PHYB8|nr:hypothetical protein PHYBLDRAFT_72664 [Phycomyces blakesleeanus NRRL 1555(-)]OAD67667.1 hypothetical protein PHYBLDRAFT_72664 [Phycomyces blakesleeanus NRRL 1555(-)]|eukprot:XP_018285707.1 hypothetical protein PHYBLDRAFT_72664 [Phycomyces blakesleeanus NRRL 1555(-)]